MIAYNEALLYFINSEQPGISEQFSDDQKLPYHQILIIIKNKMIFFLWIKIEYGSDFNVIHMDRPEVMPPALFVEEAIIGCF